MVKVGVACSMELPQERWDISKAISELHLVRDIILGARIQHNMLGYMEGKNETSHHLNVGIKLFTYFDLFS